MEVSAVAVVDGATVVIGPPVNERSVGASARRASSCSHPSPSSTSSTTWRAWATGAGIQAGSGTDGRRPTSAGTRWWTQAPP
jgi:hypothetical protein